MRIGFALGFRHCLPTPTSDGPYRPKTAQNKTPWRKKTFIPMTIFSVSINVCDWISPASDFVGYSAVANVRRPSPTSAAPNRPKTARKYNPAHGKKTLTDRKMLCYIGVSSTSRRICVGYLDISPSPTILRQRRWAANRTKPPPRNKRRPDPQIASKHYCDYWHICRLVAVGSLRSDCGIQRSSIWPTGLLESGRF